MTRSQRLFHGEAPGRGKKRGTAAVPRSDEGLPRSPPSHVSVSGTVSPRSAAYDALPGWPLRSD